VSTFSDLLAESATAARQRPQAPPGWNPRLDTDGDRAEGVTPPFTESNPDERTVVASWGLDPDEWRIDGPVNARRWQRYDGEWLHYYKANLVRVTADGRRADVAELVRVAVKRAARKTPVRAADDTALVVALNDWQIGKGEGGGSEATTARVTEQIDLLPDLIRRHRPGTVYLAGVGDLTERTSGHYASQLFTTDLNDREQLRVARALLYRAVDTVAPLVDDVLLTGVPCNHGENRNGAGKLSTTVDDSVSLTLVENVREVCAANPDRYANVRFELGRDLVHVTDLAGCNLATTHGHQFDRGAGDTMTKARRWWTGQVMGSHPVAAAWGLLTAHKHHLQLSEEDSRPVFVAPADDGGSRWFTDATGKWSPPGMLTFVWGLDVGDPATGQRCWDEVKVL
jgi:hypothetical protein